jgi:hypothetical protein
MMPSLIAVAEAEWAYWGRSTWNCITGKKSENFHTDDDDDYAQYIIDKYLPPFYKAPVKWPTVADIGGDDYAWSAVTISHFMLTAGFNRKKLLGSKYTDKEYAAWVAATEEGEFPISESHSHYIRWAIRARRDKIKSAAYWGYRVDEDEAVPDVGDLVGYPRAKNLTAKKALGFFDKTGSYNSHTDLVVARRPG